MDGGQSISKIILILTLDRMFYLSHKPVDEATDFSPIQLACTATLADPERVRFSTVVTSISALRAGALAQSRK